MQHVYLLRSCLIMLALSALSLSPLHAKTITVTSTADSGSGTLRQAVTMAVDGDEIVFAEYLNGAPIMLEGQIFLTKNITITGNGMQQTRISGSRINRIFEVRRMATVTVRDLMLYDGITKLVGGAVRVRMGSTLNLMRVKIDGSEAQGAMASMGGGGISNAGTLRIDQSVITDNVASGDSGSGGGILNEAGGQLTVMNTVIRGNVANRAGGGIEDASGSSTLTDVLNSTLNYNVVNNAPGNGGGIHLGGGSSMNVTGTMVAYNTAGAEGGGIWNAAGVLTVSDSRITGNTAAGNDADQGGGGLYNNGFGIIFVINGSMINDNRATGTSGSGGGILNGIGARLEIISSTVSGNEANRAGGGIEDISGSSSIFSIVDSRIVRNTVFEAPGNGGGVHIGGDGSLSVTGGSVSGNKAGAEGGGIWNNQGTLSLTGTLVRNNVAMGDDADQGGGGLYNNGGGTIALDGGVRVETNVASGASGSGGGILNGVDATLTIMDSYVTGNTANRAGGGIEDISGMASMFTITNSMIDDNTVNFSPGNGGGVHIGGNGSLMVSGGTVNGNTAGAEGGGIWNNLGTLTITDGTFIRGNVAMGNDADQGGGGLYNNGGGTIMLDGVTVAGNKATGTSGSGGGILNGIGATLEITDSRIIANEANRAGGGIEDISGAATAFTIMDSHVDRNRVNMSPGNGGGVHIGGDGSLSVTGGTVNENTAGAEGGGIWNNLGTLTVTGTEIADNVAMGDEADQGGGGLYNNATGTIRIMDVMLTGNRATGTSGSGGGILNNVGGSLIVSESLIAMNEANRAGGGIEDASGSGSEFTVTDSRIIDNVVNTSPGNGGGIHIGSDGDLMVTGGSVSGNTAGAEGGGIWNGMGTLTVMGTLIRDNVAMGDDADQGGGGLYNNGGGTIVLSDGVQVLYNMATGTAGSGGGILNNTDATLTITGSEISHNEANRAGGGIEDASGSASVVEVTDTRIVMNRVNMSPGNGGGVHVGSDGDFMMTGGLVMDNTAGAEGGGLWNGMGTMTLSEVTVQGNVAEGDASDNGGGGLYNDGGDMVLTDLTVRDNKATGTSGSGGGLLSVDGSIMVEGGLFVRNTANRAGGGVEIVNGSYVSEMVDYESNDAGSNPGNGGAFHVTGMASTIDFMGGSATYNVAANEGGGIWNQSGSMMSISTMNILYNKVTDPGSLTTRVSGGGVFNNGGILDIDGTTIAYNSANGGLLTGGGGIANNTGGSLTLMRSTVSGNVAGLTGGGIANDGMVEITNTTITRNEAPKAAGFAQARPVAMLTITGSIVADNIGKLSPDFGTLFGQVTSNGYNFIGNDDYDQFPETDTDLEGWGAKLEPLADNGGSTWTHRPLCSSPVIDMGNPEDTSPDQIGQLVFGERRDIGSFERQSACGGSSQPMTGTQAASTTPTGALGVFPNPVADDRLTVTLPAHFQGNVTLRIIGADGKVARLGTIQATRYRLDLSGFAPGAYTLQALHGEESQTVRFVISR